MMPVIIDRYMYNTIGIIMSECGLQDKNMQVKIYEELYSNTNAVNKSWNIRMIDNLINKHSNT